MPRLPHRRCTSTARAAPSASPLAFSHAIILAFALSLATLLAAAPQSLAIAAPYTPSAADRLEPRSPSSPHQLVFNDAARIPSPIPSHLHSSNNDQHTQQHTATVNLIDLLASSKHHTILLRLLQRTRLIPTLNRMQQLHNGNGLTLLAPTDHAFLSKRAQQQAARLASTNTRPAAKSIWEWLVPLLHDHLHDHRHDRDHDIVYNAAQDQADADADAAVQWIWHNDDVSVRDNVNAVARQHILYHILNYTLPYHIADDTGSHSPNVSLPQPGRPAMHETMHFPSRRLLRQPTHPGRLPVPDYEDHGGLIGDEGQKIRVATVQLDGNGQDRNNDKDNTHSDGLAKEQKKKRPAKSDRALAFGTDHQGQGGARSIYENWTSPYGVIHSIDAVLDLPPSLEVVLETHPRLEKLRTLLTPDLIETLSTTAHVSLFLPTSEAFDSLSDIEWRFLNGKWQQSFQDRLKIIGWHMSGVGVGGGRPAYSHRLRSHGDMKITTVLGGQVTVTVQQGDDDSDDQPIYVDDGKLVEEDIFTENGVVHLIDKMILPFGDLDMSVEKYLLALNATKFVQLFHDAGLEEYIQRSPRSRGGKEAFTFLAPRDDVIDEWMRNHRRLPGQQLPLPTADAASLDLDLDLAPGDNDGKTPTLDEVVRYHILPGLVRPGDLVDGTLLGTELRDWKLREGRQRIPVQVDDGTASRRQGNGDVGFGDANVLREPVEVKDRAVIYIISQLLEPPSNPIQTAVSHLTLSTFVATLFSAELKKAVQRAPGITYLIPTNDAFSGIGLAMNYLLLPESQPQLQRLIEYHSIDRIVYMDDFPRNATEYPTLLPAAEAKVVAERLKNGTVLVSRAGDDEGEAGASTPPPARVIKGDILTNTGVIHEIDRVEIPLDMTIKNLMQGAKADTMDDLIHQAGYDWILNGTLPPADGNSDDADAKPIHRHRGYVVLVPTDNAFTRVNLTRVLEDPISLRRLVQQHIIPLDAAGSINDILPDGSRNRLSISETASFATLLDASVGGESRYGRLSFRRIDDDDDLDTGFVIGREGGRGRGDRYNSNDSGGDNNKKRGGGGDDDVLGYLVGIKGTRGSDGSASGHSAGVLKFGRESRAIRGGVGGEAEGRELLRSGTGGVMLIDTVIVPYRPGWFYRWGWILLASVVAALAAAAATMAAYRWWNRDGKIRLPDALEGEEE